MANNEDPDEMPQNVAFHRSLCCLLKLIQYSGTEVHNFLEIPISDPLKYIIENLILIVFICMGESIRIQRVKHWHSSHYAVTHMRNKKGNIQGRSPNVVKVVFHTIRNFF